MSSRKNEIDIKQALVTGLITTGIIAVVGYIYYRQEIKPVIDKALSDPKGYIYELLSGV